MPTYRFITDNGGSHYVDLELPNDPSARREGRKAFAEAAHDALSEGDHCEMTMQVQQAERIIYRGILRSKAATLALPLMTDLIVQNWRRAMTMIRLRTEDEIAMP